MLEQYKTVIKQGQAEIVEKKSRFIATIRPVKTEQQAREFIEEMKKNIGTQRIMYLPIKLVKEMKYSVLVMMVSHKVQQVCQC